MLSATASLQLRTNSTARPCAYGRRVQSVRNTSTTSCTFMSEVDVAIVGAGVAGLAAAASQSNVAGFELLGSMV